MISILGQSINLIRPSRYVRPLIRRMERPIAKRLARTKTIKEHCGRVAFVIVQLKSGLTLGMRQGTHLDIVRLFEVDPNNIVRTGWALENGEYLWR